MKLIIFDMTNVLSNDEEKPFLAKIQTEFNLGDEFLTRYTELIQKAEVDEITGVEMWDKLQAEFNFTIDMERIEAEMCSQKYLFEGVKEIVEKLKEKYKVVYYTNFNKYYWDIILKYMDVSFFDKGFVCYELKARKPSHEGFKMILEDMDCAAEDALFIDDDIRNTTSAKELGINVIHLQKPEDLREELAKYE